MIPIGSPKSYSTPSWAAKFLKIPVFRSSLSDTFSKVIIWAYNFFSGLFGTTFRPFDSNIAQKSVDRFCALGAKVQFVTPRDNLGQVQMMTLKASDLEEKIVSMGGVWGKRTWENKDVFAITPPPIRTKEWEDLEEKFSHFRWTNTKDNLWITCDFAEVIKEETNCFLYAHSTSHSFPADWKRAGFYIGAKQDLCFFDNGNTWKNSGRRPTEESFYLEIEAVYKELKKEYLTQNIWPGGSCGGAPVAAYLKKLHHEEGIPFFAEQSFPDLLDFKAPPSCLMPYVKESLNVGAIEIENPPPQCQFGIEKMWEKLPLNSSSKFIFITAENDERISKEASQRYLDLARKINTNVTHITFRSNGKSPHADDFFNYPDSRRKFFEAVFSYTESGSRIGR